MIGRKFLTLLLVGQAALLMNGCSSDESNDTADEPENMSGKGGTEITGGRGGATGGSGGRDALRRNDACPSGTKCAAPLGSLVCTTASTGLPPTCSEAKPCSFGDCKEVFEQGYYCIQSCGPETVDSSVYVDGREAASAAGGRPEPR